MKKVKISLSEKEYKLWERSGFFELLKINRALNSAELTLKTRGGKVIVPRNAPPNTIIFNALVYGDKKIYDKTYNKLRLFLTKKNFSRAIQKIREKYEIPISGFNNTEDYDQWSERMEKKFRRSKEKIRILETKNKNIVSKESHVYFSNWEAFFHNDMEEIILKRFGLTKEFVEAIKWLILYNNLGYKTPAFEIRLKKNKNKENELWLKILSHTKKKDIVKLWDRIKVFQQYLPDHRERLKERHNIERDYEIYNLYKKYRKEIGTKKRFKTIKFILQKELPIDNYISDKIKNKYPSLTLSNIRKIISRFKKKFGDI